MVNMKVKYQELTRLTNLSFGKNCFIWLIIIASLCHNTFAGWIPWVNIASVPGNNNQVKVYLNSIGSWDANSAFGINAQLSEQNISAYSYQNMPDDGGRLITRLATCLSVASDTASGNRTYQYVPTMDYLMEYHNGAGQLRSLIVPAQRTDDAGHQYNARFVRWRSALDLATGGDGSPFVSDTITGKNFDNYNQRTSFYKLIISDVVYQPERWKIIRDSNSLQIDVLTDNISKVSDLLGWISTEINLGKFVWNKAEMQALYQAIASISTLSKAMSGEVSSMSRDAVNTLGNNLKDVTNAMLNNPEALAAADDAGKTKSLGISKSFGLALSGLTFMLDTMNNIGTVRNTFLRQFTYDQVIGRTEIEERLTLLTKIADTERSQIAT